MADTGIDAVCALVNTLVCQILAFRDLEADARELHRQLGSLRGLLESVQLTPDGERALATPEANRALAVSVKTVFVVLVPFRVQLQLRFNPVAVVPQDIAASLRNYSLLITKIRDMKKCTRFLRARESQPCYQNLRI